jgi:Arm DNA-binding domain
MTSFYDYVGLKPAWRGTQPDLIWDDEARGLCLRLYGDGSKSFIFVYCIDGHQRFIRIGQSPVWSLEAARIRAQELRSIVDQGNDPRPNVYREGGEVPPVERLDPIHHRAYADDTAATMNCWAEPIGGIVLGA